MIRGGCNLLTEWDFMKNKSPELGVVFLNHRQLEFSVTSLCCNITKWVY